MNTVNTMGKLPANEGAERALLGAVLLDNSANSQVNLLTPEDFSLDSHRIIFRCMQELSKHGKPVDVVLLGEELTHNDELDRVGGPSYLSHLSDGLPLLSNIEHYVRIVAKHAAGRRVIQICQQITVKCQDGASINELLADLKAIENDSAALRGGVAAAEKIPFRTAVEIAMETPADVEEIAFPGVVAGSISGLEGKIKSAGKTTFQL